jgi:O-antigen ligase
MVGQMFSERFGGSVEVQANQIASWLDLAFPLVLFVAIHEKKARLKIFFYFLSVLYGACFLMTSTRGSFFGLLLLPPFFAFTSKSIRATFLVLLVSLGAIGVFGNGMMQRTFNPQRGEWMSNALRKELLKSGFSLMKHNHYFFGIGFDNFKEEKYKYGFMELYDRNGHMSSHNEFFEIWLGWGAIGLFGWLYFLIGSIIHTARARVPSEIAYLKPALILALLISSIHGLFDSIIACFPFLVFLFSVLGCMSFLIKQGKLAKMRELPNFA